VRVYPAQAVTRRIEALRARTSVLTACAADEALPRTTTASRSMARRRRKRGMRTYMFDEERGFDFCTPSSTRHAVSARWHVKRLLPVVVVLGLVIAPAGCRRWNDFALATERARWGSITSPRARGAACGSTNDRNGGPDVFIGRHGVNPFMFFNDGTGSYRRRWFDLTHPPEYDSLDGDTWVDRHGCAWHEATGDGRPRRFMSRLTIEIL
jgi:hypothetical protein